MVERRTGERRGAQQEQQPTNAEKATLTMKTVVSAFLGFVLAFGGGIWAASGWKTSVDEHLDRMDQHMQYEDKQQLIQGRQLQWLIQHNPDANKAPLDWENEHGDSDNPFADITQAPQTTAESPHWRQP